MTTLIADCETDNLLPAMTRLWMLQLGNADGDDAVIYCDLPVAQLDDVHSRGILKSPVRPLSEGVERIRSADRVVFHNGLGFDLLAINRFYPGLIDRNKLLDTLVMARLAQPAERQHTLKAWGQRLGVAKGDYKGDFQQVDDELLVYAEQDIVVGRALYHAVKHVEEWGESCALEHDVAWWIIQQERNGWCFDVKGAEALEVELRGELEAISAELQKTFPPIGRSSTFTPKINNGPRGYTKGEPFTKRWAESFNPASRAHVAERLQLLGWKPKDFGADGIATVDEKVLAVLPYPQVKPLLRSFRLIKQVGMLSDGKESWLKHVQPDGRIRGRVNPNGAVTGRMSHSKPNVAQADKKDKRMRANFKPRPGWKQVGCDAESLEACMLAHFLARWDGGALADRIVNGSKSAGTDTHTTNLRALHRAGLLVVPKGHTPELVARLRDGAKTTLYAQIYGAGPWKLGETVKGAARDAGLPPCRIPSKECGLLVRKALAQAMVGLDKLSDAIQAKAKSQGYLVGLDGRHLFVRSEHSALNTLLQGAGAIVMKKALQIFGDWLDASYIDGTHYGLNANVHDEVQMEVIPELAVLFGRQFASSITQAGVALGVRCPLAGAYEVGDSWAGTH